MVIVVGGGPAGSSTAFFLAQQGFEVTVLDRARFPRDKTCSEYLSPQASRILEAMNALSEIEQSGAAQLAGMRVHAPNGATIHGEFAADHGFRGYRDRGLAVRRTILDSILLNRARDAGACVEEGVRVTDVIRSADGTVTAPVYVTQGSINSASVPPWPAPALTHYAKITSTNGAPPIVTTDGSNVPGKYNYLGCLEVTASVSQGFLVGLTNALAETVVSQFGDHLIFDRMYVHGVNASSTVQMTRGFLVTGSNISVVNSYVSQIYSSGGDAQAILGAHGPGPYLIQNNFLSASTEIIMFGGTGRTPGYSCTIAASPAPTTTTATVNTCIDFASGAVSTPAVGTCAMFYIGSAYTPANWVCITANSSGALTWSPALPSAPSTGAGKIKYGMVPADITINKNYLYKLPSWNSAVSCVLGLR